MTRPASTADFGTVLDAARLDAARQGSATACTTRGTGRATGKASNLSTVVDAAVARHVPTRTGRNHSRFADIKARLNGTMPTVKIGAVYEDLDPRSAGRCVQVLDIDADNMVLVRTIIGSHVERRTPAKSRKDTIGQVSRIAMRRFRENSRGFKYLHGTPLRNVHALLLAARIADGCGIAVTEQEIRLADAIIGLLGGKRRANIYVDELMEADALRDLYLNGGTKHILADAVMFTTELGLPEEWAEFEVLSKATAATVVEHTV